ncbi:alpha-ketoglutarate-dependent dioxygenase AlkB [Variovorax sp. NFACC27]|uniref:Alpha-ketoglutarate-dependent dioxygenase AlkB n=1 Tax=Variovorax gossypii TaxID=1679495 RepID=A0A431TRE3_9BURK|nr:MULTISPECIES: alpha-ketoglutarate-dependent dioxygenase AlkB [Variovorax]SEF28009.1 Alkylated DNA repair dioxygenase AlkB [Variovorax sp. NFACC28]SEG69143.1 Alkylated DNA repair dioxygenase AlkB [Variovorax sp. NFACC29]SFC84997.1 Alkylated DNA repair dioxygenase AlkB [Variovorax sp. NFACC26]SFF97241.1 Alkylated DNA repair dioxygenase AlkB [Variovorax sp. NFACC27]RTQ36769.1 alpha-ketoglutarate-dependent dioxygenase AlkB [Variovorax gossypii]
MTRATRRLEHAGQPDLFGEAPVAAIEGLRYESGFLSREEEAGLLRIVQALPLKEMRYKEYTARRRGTSFGGSYDFDTNRLKPGAPLPEALHPLRAKAAAWAGMAPEELTHMLIAEYRPGTPLGWHRDVPDFEDIIGVSLQDDAVMQFRPYVRGAPASGPATLEFLIEPRSVYLLRGPARWEWQHAIAPTKALRYSITLRTRRLSRT